MSSRQLSFIALTVATITVLAFGVSTSACLWIHGTGMNGESVTTNGHMYDLLQVNPQKSIEEWKGRLESYEQRAKQIGDAESRSDYAGVLIHLGEYEKAIHILEEVERIKPKLYETAANLGTAFELSGDNEQALEWISEGIKRRADSHYGSEWVHVKILEAKMAIAKDPDWLKTHSVLDVDFGTDARPGFATNIVDAKGNLRTAIDIRQAIEYQLHERLGFVTAPEPIVGELLFDLANLHELTATLESAVPIYDLALKFGVKNIELAKTRREYAAKILKDNDALRAEWAKQAKLAAPPVVDEAAEQMRRNIGIAVIAVCGTLSTAGIVILVVRQNRRAYVRRNVEMRTPVKRRISDKSSSA